MELFKIFEDWVPNAPDRSYVVEGHELVADSTLWTTITSMSTKIHVDMFEFAKTMDPQPSDMVKGYLAFRLKHAYKATTPLVKVYLEEVEPRYQKSMQKQGLKAQSFPNELIAHIASFALPDNPLLSIPPELADLVEEIPDKEDKEE